MLKTVYTKQLYTRTRSILRPPRRPCDEADKNIFVPEIKYLSVLPPSSRPAQMLSARRKGMLGPCCASNTSVWCMGLNTK